MSATATPGIPLGPKFRLAAPGKVMHIDVMRVLFLQRVYLLNLRELEPSYNASILSQNDHSARSHYGLTSLFTRPNA
jgi:hypothetical protein